jgi:hypothetical protein
VFVIHLYNDVSRSVYFIKTIRPWIMCISSWTNNHSTVNHVFIQPWHISEKNHCSYCVHNDYTIIKYINQQCTGCVYTINVRDQPFNLKGRGGLWFFVSFRIFFWSRKGRTFFPEFNIRLYDKNSESDYFFFLHQNQNIFFSHIGNQNIFFRKKP